MKIVIVDEHPIFRRGLREIIVADTDHELVGEAGDGASALQLIQRLKPDAMILDV